MASSSTAAFTPLVPEIRFKTPSGSAAVEAAEDGCRPRELKFGGYASNRRKQRSPRCRNFTSSVEVSSDVICESNDSDDNDIHIYSDDDADFATYSVETVHHSRSSSSNSSSSSSSSTSSEELSPDSMELVKLVILGASAVGKTSIIQQFVWNEFNEEYTSTEKKETWYPSVIINDHLYELKIIDIPVIPYFPVSSLYEWTDFRFYGLRNATAYILVYDLHTLDTFQYIKALRDQIYESRDMHNVPLFVVGNKHDLCSTRDRRDIVNLVKKQWKCGYIECSAKYNWHIVTMFKEVMKTIDYIDYGQKTHNSPGLQGLSGAIQRNKCVIL